MPQKTKIHGPRFTARNKENRIANEYSILAIWVMLVASPGDAVVLLDPTNASYHGTLAQRASDLGIAASCLESALQTVAGQDSGECAAAARLFQNSLVKAYCSSGCPNPGELHAIVTLGPTGPCFTAPAAKRRAPKGTARQS